MYKVQWWNILTVIKYSFFKSMLYKFLNNNFNQSIWINTLNLELLSEMIYNLWNLEIWIRNLFLCIIKNVVFSFLSPRSYDRPIAFIKKRSDEKERIEGSIYTFLQWMIDTNGFKRREMGRERRPTLSICCLLY